MFVANEVALATVALIVVCNLVVMIMSPEVVLLALVVLMAFVVRLVSAVPGKMMASIWFMMIMAYVDAQMTLAAVLRTPMAVSPRLPK